MTTNRLVRPQHIYSKCWLNVTSIEQMNHKHSIHDVLPASGSLPVPAAVECRGGTALAVAWKQSRRYVRNTALNNADNECCIFAETGARTAHHRCNSIVLVNVSPIYHRCRHRSRTFGPTLAAGFLANRDNVLVVISADFQLLLPQSVAD